MGRPFPVPKVNWGNTGGGGGNTKSLTLLPLSAQNTVLITRNSWNSKTTRTYTCTPSKRQSGRYHQTVSLRPLPYESERLP